MDDSALARIRDDPASAAGRKRLGRVLAAVIADIPAMTSVDAPRLRAVARLLEDVAPYQPTAERAAAKGFAAVTDSVADFLDELGETAREGFGGW